MWDATRLILLESWKEEAECKEWNRLWFLAMAMNLAAAAATTTFSSPFLGYFPLHSVRIHPSFFSLKYSIPPRAKVVGIWVFSFLSSLFVFHMFISCCRYGSIRFCWWKYTIAPLQCLKFWILKFWALPISFQWLEIFFIHSLCILIFCILQTCSGGASIFSQH